MSTSHDTETRIDGNGAVGDERFAPEEVTRADTEWPIPREYRVEPLAAPGADEPDERVAAAPRSEAPPRRRPWPFPAGDVVAGLVVLLLLALGAGAWYVLHGQRTSASSTPPSASGSGLVTPPTSSGKKTAPRAKAVARVAAPAVVGSPLDGARKRLEQAGLRVEVRTKASNRPSGTVLRQTPSSGTGLAKGATVILLVSSGPRPVRVPNVVGGEAQYAARALRDAGLQPAIVLVRSSEPAGAVLAQSPAAGSRVPHGAEVTVRVARRPPRPVVTTVAVPDVVGLQVAGAQARLEALGLRWRVTQGASERPEGEVVNQSPAAGGRLRKGDRVSIGVSTGPSLVAVPDVTGLDEASARTALAQRGFDVVVVGEPTSDPTQDGTVTDESPPGGTNAKPGATVTITVARYG